MGNEDDFTQQLADAQSQADDATAQTEDAQSQLDSLTTEQMDDKSSDEFMNVGNDLQDSISNLQTLVEEIQSSTLSYDDQVDSTMESDESVLSDEEPEETEDTEETRNLRYANLIKIIKSKVKLSRDKIIQLEEYILLLNDVMESKQVIINNLKTSIDEIIQNNNDNNNYIVTTGRLSYFYDKNINKQNKYLILLKIVFYLLFAYLIFISRNDLKDIIKGTIDIPAIYKSPQIPTIISLVLLLLTFIWLFNNKQIHEISIPMIFCIIIYILFIQLCAIKLKDNPLYPALFGVPIVPYFIFYMIEKMNMDKNIIPLYEKNTRLAYNVNKKVQELESTNKLIDKINKNAVNISGNLINLESTSINNLKSF